MDNATMIVEAPETEDVGYIPGYFGDAARMAGAYPRSPEHKLASVNCMY